MLDDFICKKDEQAAGRRGKNEGKDNTREKQRKRERERETQKERGKDVKGRRKLIAIYSMNHRVDKAAGTFKGRQKETNRKKKERKKKKK